MADEESEQERLRKLEAVTLVQRLVLQAIEQRMDLFSVAEAMLIDAVALLSNLDPEKGKRHAVVLLRAAADSLEKGPTPMGRA